jgi:hypothetical protein
MLSGLFGLGQKIADEVGADEGVDTLGRWFSHYLAERIEETEQNPSKKDEVAELILRLWQHRASLQLRSRPLEKYEPIMKTLERLNPEGVPVYVRLETAFNSAKSDSDWLNLALEIDRTARSLISFCLAQGVRESELADDPWMEAAKDIEPDQHIVVLRELYQLGEKYPLVEEGGENNEEDEFQTKIDNFINNINKIRQRLQGAKDDDLK